MSFSIIGTGSSLPSFIVKNEDLSKIVDTNDEWITTRTGIKERRIIRDESLLDIAEKATRAALKDANTDASELDLIICSTLQGDTISPSLACLVLERLGVECPAFDINAACPGFVYALDVAAAYFESKKAKKVLVLSAEQLSKFTNWEDRKTCVLFGDGAGAVVLGEGDGLKMINLKAKGQRESLYIPAFSPDSPFVKTESSQNQFLDMKGQEIYKFAVYTVTEDVLFAAQKAGIEIDDIDYFLLHQANGRIIEAARNRLNQPASKFPMNLCNLGNTSSATIPILLDEMNQNNQLKDGDILLMSAFGAGLTSGVCILKWGK
ncbi:MAG: ketoacyl-ACP synthase III [Clostridiales bacterium]|nr:ketoacyl-ACP synthase III [Clostridiales bacterium]